MTSINQVRTVDSSQWCVTETPRRTSPGRCVEPERGWSYSVAVADRRLSDAEKREQLPPADRRAGGLRYYVPQDILDVSFPVSVRGYDRGAVDAYTERVNQAIAELKMRASPPAAVRHALEQAEEKVQGLLQAAREAAEEITVSAQREAEETTARARAASAELVVDASAEAERMKVEADELVATAKKEADETVIAARGEAQSTVARAKADADERHRRLEEELTALRNDAQLRIREIEADTDAVSNERQELLDDIGRIGGSLVELASVASARSRGHQAGLQEEMPELEAEEETESQGADEFAQTTGAIDSQEGRDAEARHDAAERSGA